MDAVGPGHAQPDFVLTHSGRVWVFECKLTFRPSAIPQLTGLYVPLLRALLGTEPVPVVVFRNPGDLREETHHDFALVSGQLREVLEGRASGFLLHWLPL